MDISRGTWADAGMTTSLYYDVPRLIHNKEYLFRVKATNTIGDSDYLETAKTTIARNEFGETSIRYELKSSGFHGKKNSGFSNSQKKSQKFVSIMNLFGEVNNQGTEIIKIINFSFCSDEPDAPEKPVVKDWDEDHVDLEWERPKSDGGSPIQEYIIQKKEKGNVYWVNAAKVPGNSTKVSDSI